ncbi:hypothetical protein [Desulfovibrio litoralis]|uniref:Uncharacterized protein n=1 Tax=Desulfovibrio litoralis DSM 11393 TaxID=1121455 RepID=A0A1M7RRL4_9BACT|nr:hypothetical protein [Desulfovibrio litoralis]SHN48762.1 hypothetical protein SAMN02745728_00042 [Desulfovibrio litoralis DSM 11393]
MKQTLSKQPNQFQAPLLILNTQSKIIDYNLLAKDLFEAHAINIEAQNEPTSLFCTKKNLTDFFKEAQTNGFSMLFEASLNLETKKPQPLYNLYAFSEDEQTQLFICQNAENDENSEKQKAQVLLDKTLKIFLSDKEFGVQIQELFKLLSRYLETDNIQLFKCDPLNLEFRLIQSKTTAQNQIVLPRKLDIQVILPSLATYLSSHDYFLETSQINTGNIFKRFIQLNKLKSLLALPLKENNTLNAIFVFENKNIKWSAIQLDTVSKISQLLNLFIIEKQETTGNYETKFLEQLIAESKAIIGIVDQETNNVLFANKLFMDTTDFETMNLRCWNSVVHSEAQSCENCVLNNKQFTGRFTKDVYLPNLKAWFRIEHKTFNWVNNKRLILFWAENISPMRIDEHNIQKKLKTDPLTGELNIETGFGLLQQMLNSAQTKDDKTKLLPKISEMGIEVVAFGLDNYNTLQEALGSEAAILAFKKFIITMKNEFGFNDAIIINKNSFFAIFDNTVSTTRLKFNIRQYFNKANENINNISSYMTESSFGTANSLQLNTQNAHELVKAAHKNMLLFRRNKLNSLNNTLL